MHNVMSVPITSLTLPTGESALLIRRGLNAEDVRNYLKSERPQFVVADPGKPFVWVQGTETYSFHKSEVTLRLATDLSRIDLNSFPGAYCYVASAWRSESGIELILLEKYH
jgi:hypothetical protein